MIKNNKAQSMITIMLLIMVLGVVVTLIVSSTITDTRKLLVQKSYERAYSLSEQYLTKIISGNVLGASQTTINGVLVGDHTATTCGVVPASNTTDYTPSIEMACNGVGSDNNSIVNCTRTPEIFGKSLKIQPDEPVNLDYSKNPVSGGSYVPFNLTNIQTASPKIYLRYKNADAVQVTYKYTELIGGLNIPKSVSFVVSDDQTNFPGAVPVPSNISSPTALADIVNKGNPVIKDVATSSPSANIQETLGSITGLSIKEFYIDLNSLASNIKLDINHTAKSLQIKFLKTTQYDSSPAVVEFAIHQSGNFPADQQQFTFQFHKFKCDAFDSAYGTTSLGDEITTTPSTGFGSARLEAFVPINKALPDFFDYSLFVGGGIGGNSSNGYPVIINK